jgi:hypothetical protein
MDVPIDEARAIKPGHVSLNNQVAEQVGNSKQPFSRFPWLLQWSKIK